MRHVITIALFALIALCAHVTAISTTPVTHDAFYFAGCALTIVMILNSIKVLLPSP